MATKYVALLLGINVGHRQVKMVVLKSAMVGLGFLEIKTLLASGNVIFKVEEKSPRLELKQRIEKKLEDTFGFSIRVILLSAAEINALIDLKPFESVHLTPAVRLYVTFAGEVITNQARTELLAASQPGFRVLHVTDRWVFGVVTLENGSRTVDAMKILTKHLGKNITVRNWNTVVKIATALQM